jgi:phosphatidylinositol glycan class H protein
VRFYLAIVVEGEENVIVVFPRMLPKRAILEEVWRGSRKCLWDSDVGRGKGKGRANL